MRDATKEIGRTHIQADSEEKAKENAKKYMQMHLGLQGFSNFLMFKELDENEEEIKERVKSISSPNGMIYDDGKYVHRGNLKSN